VPGPRYAVTVCVLLRRGDAWLLSVRAPGVAYAPGSIGLIGGHVESAAPEPGVLESTARREFTEETGLDLDGVPLRYLESEYFVTPAGEPQITVTFVAAAPDGAAPFVNAPDELTEVGWWTVGEVAADPRCPSWLPGLLGRAAALG
jgi:8-oxo-dGTP pyrophosphatase MutT (NUDIX family)